MEAPQPPTPPEVAVKKTGLPTVAWVGIGCGAVLILMVVVLAMLIGTCSRKVTAWANEMEANPAKGGAELMVRLNPEIEMVSQDEQAGEMTIRIRKTGETVTLGYDDIAEGRFTVTDAEGATTSVGVGGTGQVPEWVPLPPDAESTVSAFHHQADDKVAGMVSMKTGTSVEELAGFYGEAAEALGLGSSSSRSAVVNDTETRTLVFSGGSRTLTVQISAFAGEPDKLVQVAYEEQR